MPSRLLSAWATSPKILDELVEAVDGPEDRLGEVAALLAERLGEGLQVLEVLLGRLQHDAESLHRDAEFVNGVGQLVEALADASAAFAGRSAGGCAAGRLMVRAAAGVDGGWTHARLRRRRPVRRR